MAFRADSRLFSLTGNSLSKESTRCRAERDLNGLRRYYLMCIGSLWVIFIVGGIVWVLLGDWALDIIHSKTHFVVRSMLCAMLAVNILENNHAVSAGFIMADNKIPFFIPSLLSGVATVVLLWFFLCPLQMGVWGLVLAPGIAQLVYQNWKWPFVVVKELWGKEDE